ncbi:MAG: amino acid adenylation domain-containing protein, partial [Prevotella sp.]|nr:amino acid adenylation domain-containing protein [Prevotella sp.]
QAQTDLGQALFQSTMVFENYPVPQGMDETLEEWNFRPVQTEEEPFNELSIVIGLRSDGTLEINIAYDPSLYPQEEIGTVENTFTSILQSMAAQSDARIKDIRIVTEEEQTELIKLGTGERIEYDPTETLVSLFRAQAAKTPDNIAVVFKDQQLTYRELDDLTDRLAAYLINYYHVQPEEAIGVMIERSELMAVYPLAIMKAGAAYMPLDFNFPEERLQYMCQDAEVRLILSQEDRVYQAMPSFNEDVFTSDALETLPKCSSPLPDPLPSHRYVILYTSGSTGKPKGVALEHHGIVNFCHWYNKEFRMTSDDRALAYSNFGFDAHMMDLYPAMTCGASVYIIDSEMRMDIGRMNHYMEDNAVSIAFLTTQIGHFFASSIENHSLRLLSVSGEKLSAVRKPPYEFYNCCGHTECTIYTTYYKIENDYDTPVVGRPLANYQLYVVDSSMRLLPCGVAGELIICGEGVGRGYLYPSDKDAEKFTTFMGLRAYRTGDLCRWNGQGELEYLSRIDSLVKLRGFRIELGEIESRMMKYDGIHQAVASVYDGQLLCLYYTADSDI